MAIVAKSLVGGTMISAKPAKATMPIRVLSACSSINLMAASWATERRLGSTSVAHMLRDTSMANMMVVRLRGTSPAAWGRDTAVIERTEPNFGRQGRIGYSKAFTKLSKLT